MNFDYNVFESESKKDVRISNNNLIKISDEVWVFSDNIHSLTDDVIFEVSLARKHGCKVRFFQLPGFKEADLDFQNLHINIEYYYGNRLRNKDRKLVYTARASKLFYYRIFISKYVLGESKVPLNPFMSFDYFLSDKVERESVLKANSKMIEISDELWVFGRVSDGVQAELQLAEELGIPVRYFEIEEEEIREIQDEKKIEIEK